MIRKLLEIAVNIYSIILVGRWVIEVILPQHKNSSWFLKIRDVTEPVLDAIRRVVPPVSGIDFAYVIAILGIQAAARLIIFVL